MKPCKKHEDHPETGHLKGFHKCPWCEIEKLRCDVERLKEAVKTYNGFNNITNDKDAYLYAMGQWALGVENEKPLKEDYGW